MVADETEAADDICCASCGIAEVDEIKLNECDDCDLVRYCSDKCQQDHRPQHDAICKERAAELRDEILFKQPDGSYLGDCPICCLPLSLDIQRAMLHTCCSKWICDGCAFANKLREIEARLQQTCPFCRHPPPATLEEVNKNDMKRAAANDPVAMRQLGTRRYLEGDYVGAFEYCTKAAELGDALAHYKLSHLYLEGEGAAIAGHPDARFNLACHEMRNKRYDKAVKHFIIAANLGDDDSIQQLKEFYVDGEVSKDEFAAALRAHQAAVDATKSPQREAAKDNA
eukprot:scaffold4929_cov102-Skeletonema_marinoi.AAC.5